jgi:hypothetical protein
VHTSRDRSITHVRQLGPFVDFPSSEKRRNTGEKRERKEMRRKKIINQQICFFCFVFVLFCDGDGCGAGQEEEGEEEMVMREEELLKLT